MYLKMCYPESKRKTSIGHCFVFYILGPPNYFNDEEIDRQVGK